MTRIIKAPEERKQELILTAQKLFLEKGYSDTTVRDIINAVNGSQGMFYHYFKSKDDIYRAAMDEFIANYIDELKTTALNDKVPFEIRVKQIIIIFKKTFSESLSSIFVSATAENENYLLQIRMKIIYNVSGIIEALIKELIEKGIIDKDEIYNGRISDAATFLANGIAAILNKNLIMSRDNTNEVDTELLNTLLSFISKFLNIHMELIK